MAIKQEEKVYKYSGVLRTCVVDGTVREANPFLAIRLIHSMHKATPQEWDRLTVLRQHNDGTQELVAEYPKKGQDGTDKYRIKTSGQEGKVVDLSPRMIPSGAPATKTPAVPLLPAPGSNPPPTHAKPPAPPGPPPAPSRAVSIKLSSIIKTRPA